MQRNDDNRANQLNPNNDAYWQSRGYAGRPDGWEWDWEDWDDGEEDEVWVGEERAIEPPVQKDGHE